MKRIVIIAIMLVLAASTGYAGNVDTYGIGSKATAMGGAYSAYANDPYAAYYNPAGLSQIDGKLFSVGIHMIDPTINVENYRVSNTNDPQIKGPKDFSDDSPNLFPPHLGFAMPLSNTLTLGLAAYVPWGLEIEWDKYPANNPGAYDYFHSYYIREVVTPTIAYKINEKWSIGFGLSLGKTKAGEERRMYVSPNIGQDPVLGPSISKGVSDKAAAAIAQVEAANQSYGGLVPTITTTSAAYNFLSSVGKTAEAAQFKPYVDKGLETPDQIGAATLASYNGVAAIDHGAHVEATLEDDFNYSFNIGVMYKPIESISLGLTYRSRTSVSLDGTLEKNGAELEGVDVTLDYDHPDQIQFGIRYVPQSYKNLSVEFDLVWTHWSINETQAAYITPGLPVDVVVLPDGTKVTNLQKDSIYHRDWEDTRQIRFGVEWKATNIVTLRAGYFYDPTPIPDDKLDLMWPDADKKIYSIGCGLNFGRLSVDTTFQYCDIEKARYIGGESENWNKAYKGTYSDYNAREVSASADGNLWGLGLTLNYKF